MGAKALGVNDSKIDLPFVFLSDWFEGFGQFGALLGRFRENVGERETSLRRELEIQLQLGFRYTYFHVASVCIWANFTNEGGGGSPCKCRNGLLVKFPFERVLSFIERLI